MVRERVFRVVVPVSSPLAPLGGEKAPILFLAAEGFAAEVCRVLIGIALRIRGRGWRTSDKLVGQKVETICESVQHPVVIRVGGFHANWRRSRRELEC